jgi:DNA-binding response OmpR family regulator
MEQTKPKNILCIEDERFIGELYERALTKAGHKIEVVNTGDKGLERAMSDEFDVILLDIIIPEMLGVDVLKRLRSDKPDLRAKVIIATNLEQDEKTRQSIEKDADGYVIKADITPKELVRFIESL